MSDAFVFPGQGSHAQGMQTNLRAEFPEAVEAWSEAGDVLGVDLWAIVRDGPAEKLDMTTVTQPVMLTAGVAAWRAWRAGGGDAPSVMSGHSLGEYSALVAAEAMSFADALRLVKLRSELMQEAVPAGVGAMAAVLGLDDEAVIAVCADAAGDDVVDPVNFNAPGQVVIAGHATAVERAAEAAKAAGAKRVLPLPLSVPAHSALMRAAGEALAEALAEATIDTPIITTVAASDATPYTDGDDIRRRLSRQVYSPVRWVDTVRAMLATGADRVIECGPGKVLAGLMRRIDRNVPVVAFNSLDDLRGALGHEPTS